MALACEQYSLMLCFRSDTVGQLDFHCCASVIFHMVAQKRNVEGSDQTLGQLCKMLYYMDNKLPSNTFLVMSTGVPILHFLQ